MRGAASVRPSAHVAVSDCERIRPGLVAQPVNTASSLAYCAAGAFILRRGPRTGRRVLLGAAAMGAGVGSVAYHGPGGTVSRTVHDVTAAGLAGTVAFALAAVPGTGRRLTTLGCLCAAGAVHAASRSGRVLCRPDSVWQGHALWHVLGAAAAVLAAGE